jgi:hypothetical protein
MDRKQGLVKISQLLEANSGNNEFLCRIKNSLCY